MQSEVKDGGPAFPHQPLDPHGLPLCESMPGLTVRDWFAGQAMAGLMANYANSVSAVFQVEEIKEKHGLPTASKAIAWMSYRYADDMLAAREGYGGFGHRVAVVTRDRRMAVADVIACGNGDDRRAHDARLIAAAPEMYEALRELVEDIERYQAWARRQGKYNSQLARIGKSARDAIAKAEGGADHA